MTEIIDIQFFKKIVIGKEEHSGPDGYRVKNRWRGEAFIFIISKVSEVAPAPDSSRFADQNDNQVYGKTPAFSCLFDLCIAPILRSCI